MKGGRCKCGSAVVTRLCGWVCVCGWVGVLFLVTANEPKIALKVTTNHQETVCITLMVFGEKLESSSFLGGGDRFGFFCLCVVFVV